MVIFGWRILEDLNFFLFPLPLFSKCFVCSIKVHTCTHMFIYTHIHEYKCTYILARCIFSLGRTAISKKHLFLSSSILCQKSVIYGVGEIKNDEKGWARDKQEILALSLAGVSL